MQKPGIDQVDRKTNTRSKGDQMKSVENVAAVIGESFLKRWCTEIEQMHDSDFLSVKTKKVRGSKSKLQLQSTSLRVQHL
jgi:hypothetical protein